MAAADDVAHWRAQIFARLLLIVLVLGLFTALPSIVLAIREGLWSVAIIDTVALVWIGAVWRMARLRYTTRVLNFLAVAYLVGVVLLLKVGPVSQIYLMSVPVLAALLLGMRSALWALAVTAFTLLALGYLAQSRLPLEGMNLAIVLKSAVIALNYLFITAVLTLSCAALLRNLSTSHEALGGLNAELRLTGAAVARLNDMVTIAQVQQSDGSACIIFVNAAFEQRSGYTREEAVGRGLRLLQGPDTDADTLARIAKAMEQGEAVRAELLNYSKAGEAYWVETELVPFADAGGNHTHWVAVERDIGERKRSEDAIHRLAFYDVLTGLPNRRLLEDRIERLLAGAARGHAISAVMFVDLDHFKNINDARGHAIGDALLRDAADRLSALMRHGDTVARIGGDEFVVLLTGLGDDAAGATHGAMLVAEKIRAAIARHFDILGQSYKCSASIGVTLLCDAGKTADDLLREADTAMYRAKAGGRDGIAFFEAAMQTEVERRLSLEHALAAALDAGQLAMHGQAQVDCDGQVVGAEMLMRWCRPDGTMVPPAIFIPIAEESGLIVRLGVWALRQACLALLRLAEAGHPIALSVNVSPSQFRQADFVEQVRQVLGETGAPAHLLILEVTEGLLIDKEGDTIGRMHALAALGIRFSIDDFGTGYSSLAYLKTMPLYELKIDRSFICDAPHDANGSAIVQAILAMARHLRLRVVAEGVETQAQADFLVANGCDCMQGYLFAHPMPMAELLDFLAAKARAARKLHVAGPMQ